MNRQAQTSASFGLEDTFVKKIKVEAKRKYKRRRHYHGKKDRLRCHFRPVVVHGVVEVLSKLERSETNVP